MFQALQVFFSIHLQTPAAHEDQCIGLELEEK